MRELEEVVCASQSDRQKMVYRVHWYLYGSGNMGSGVASALLDHDGGHMRLVSTTGISRLRSFFQFVPAFRSRIGGPWSISLTHIDCTRRNKLTCSFGVPVLKFSRACPSWHPSKLHPKVWYRAWVQLNQCKYQSPWVILAKKAGESIPNFISRNAFVANLSSSQVADVMANLEWSV
jgi:hypothetical protein